MARWMVTLVGEQPMPVYSLIREPELRPDWVLFVASDRTLPVVQRIRPLLKEIPSEACVVEPYSIEDVMAKLHAELAAVPADGSVIFNLTGGTKTMIFGAMEVARQRGAEVVYLKSENDTQVFRYAASEEDFKELPPLPAVHPISLHEYLTIHLGEYGEEPPEKHLRGVNRDEVNSLISSEHGRVRGRFLEQEVRDTLLSDPRIDEVKVGIDFKAVGGLEIDLAVRVGSGYGVGSIKGGRLRDKQSQVIEEIAAISQSRVLGTYVKRFVIVARRLDDNIHKLCDTLHVIPIELESFEVNHGLSEEDRTKLVNTIVEAMQPRAR